MKRPAPTSPIDPSVQRRLDRLELLIDTEYGGSPARFEEKTGIKMTQVSQWFTGYRALREKAVARLITHTKKPDGWFDAPMPSDTDGGAQPVPLRPKLRTSELVLQLRDAMRLAEKHQRAAALSNLAALIDHIDDDARTVHLAELIEMTLTPLPGVGMAGGVANAG